MFSVMSDTVEQLQNIISVMAKLRDPDTGCPWDVKQDFASIAPYTIEEAYEVADAIAAGDVVVFAVPGASVSSVVGENLGALEDKIIIDASNNMRGESRHALGFLREKLPSAHLYRAFSSLGWENLDNPDFGDIKADLFYCGDEAGRATLDQIISDLGLDPVYLGGVEQVGLVEGMTDMWFNLALRQKMGRRIAFKLLK